MSEQDETRLCPGHAPEGDGKEFFFLPVSRCCPSGSEVVQERVSPRTLPWVSYLRTCPVGVLARLLAGMSRSEVAQERVSPRTLPWVACRRTCRVGALVPLLAGLSCSEGAQGRVSRCTLPWAV